MRAVTIIVLGLLAGTVVGHAAPQKYDPWERTLDRVTNAVVSIRMERPRSYDGKGRSNSQATGFVIDAERGLLLTNRHVVTAGPTTAQAVFRNHEVVPLRPLYRDPVHDFGVFQFDPALLKYHEPGQLGLHPERARVGAEIRVVGNDSGEQLSILDATLARLDRAAPKYGAGYNDFNTFYYQASSGTSGGSSGSPVVDVRGRVLALNAGSNRNTASAYYLPLDRVVRAVKLIQEGQAVPRGTLQAVYQHTSYDELRRLGMSERTEASARKRWPDGTGLLVVREVVPLGPADGLFKVGDILLTVAGQPAVDFVAVEAALDNSVGESIAIGVERAGQPLVLTPTVGDLHAITPASILEIGGSVVHKLSYHQARNQRVPVRGVYVADEGYMFQQAHVPRHAVIVEVNGTPVSDLANFREALDDLGDGSLFTVRWFARGKPQATFVTPVRLDRRWFAERWCDRDDGLGRWDCVAREGTVESEPTAMVKATFPPQDDKRIRAIQRSLVLVDYDLPYKIAGVAGATFVGSGLILDAERGLVAVDRDTVPVGLGDVRLRMAGAVQIPGRVVAIHPVHNVAIVAYDTSLVRGIPLVSAQLRTDLPKAGETLWHIGQARDQQLGVHKTKMLRTTPLVLPAQGTPRFRQSNLEVLTVQPRPVGNNGVLVDKKGQVVALWASFSWTKGSDVSASLAGLPARILAEALDLAHGETQARSLGWELVPLPIPAALERGLPADRVAQVLEHDPERRKVFVVSRTERGDPLADVLRSGDILLEVDGALVTRMHELDAAIRGRDEVKITVVRQGQVVSFEVPTQRLSSVGVVRVVMWAGMRLHEPHRAARFDGVEPGRPYVAWWNSGSPAGRGKVYARRWVVSVDGVDTPDLDALLAQVKGKATGESVRLELRTSSGQVQVKTVVLDNAWWPTEELRWVDGQWVRSTIE
ncbi:MAG: S1-C subfamily serine protease [Kiritimatiellia bacterium]|jgi:S1-C subfamily serine protease